MSGNTQPQFTKTGFFGAINVPSSATANTKSDGTGTIGTDIFLIGTSGSDDTWIDVVRAQPTASTAGTATTATVARYFLSTQSSGATTNANTHNVGEVTLNAQTADSSSAAVSPVDYPLNIRVPTGMSLLVSMHASPAANTSWKFTAPGGNY